MSEKIKKLLKSAEEIGPIDVSVTKEDVKKLVDAGLYGKEAETALKMIMNEKLRSGFIQNQIVLALKEEYSE